MFLSMELYGYKQIVQVSPRQGSIQSGEFVQRLRDREIIIWRDLSLEMSCCRNNVQPPPTSFTF